MPSLPYTPVEASQGHSFWGLDLFFGQKVEDLRTGLVLETGQGITTFYWVVALSLLIIQSWLDHSD